MLLSHNVVWCGYNQVPNPYRQQFRESLVVSYLLPMSGKQRNPWGAKNEHRLKKMTERSKARVVAGLKVGDYRGGNKGKKTRILDDTTPDKYKMLMRPIQ